MSFFEELKRRNVVRVGIAYAVAAWLLIQVTDIVFPRIGLPDSAVTLVIALLVIGFLPAVVFAWAFELTPEGIKREREVDRAQSITPRTARRLDWVIIGSLALVVAWLLFDEYYLEPREATTARAVSALEPDTASDAANETLSIAVLPFADMSEAGDQEYFSDGIAEELLNLLARVDGLDVASRTSSFSYKGEDLNLAEIAQELKVGHILEGSVRKAGNRLRITAQLIDAETDRHLWSDTYDRELTDIFTIQDEIANSIVTALQDELGLLQDAAKITVNADTQNLDAYELYLEGRSWFLSRKDLGRSVELLETAVKLDPGFARAWESLGAAYSVAESWGVPGKGLNEKARTASYRALELDPALSTPHAVLGSDYIEQGRDFIRGMAELDLAIKNDSKNATAWFWRGINYSTLGFTDKGIEDVSRCIELDPAYWNCYRHLARLYLIAGDLQTTLDTYQVSLDQGVTINDFWMVPVYLELDMDSAAIRLVESESRGDPTYPGALLIEALKDPGMDTAAAIARLDQWNENLGLEPVWRNAEWVALGAYERVGPSIDNNRFWTPAYAAFRASRYFKPLLEKAGLPDYWRVHGFPPMCRPFGEDDFECE